MPVDQKRLPATAGFYRGAGCRRAFVSIPTAKSNTPIKTKMKRTLILTLSLLALTGLMMLINSRLAAQETGGLPEYITLHWDGRENTHLIRPGGIVELLGSKFKGVKKPDRADERSYFMNVAMNTLTTEGYELVAMTPDDYVFRRPVRR